MENSRGGYIPECLHMVNRNRIVSVMVWALLASVDLAIRSLSMKT